MTPDTLAPPSPVSALRTLARVGAYLRPYRREVAYAAVALLIAAGAVLAVGQGLRTVIDHGFGARDGAELDRALAAMLAIVVVMAAATYTRFYFVSLLGERVTADLRRDVFDHLLRLPPQFFELTRTGEVISRLTNDTTMLETVIGSSASMAIRNVLLMAGGLVMLALTSAKLTLLVLVGVPLVLVPIIFFGRRVRKLARATQDRVGDVGAYVDEALHEIRTVQAYGHEGEDRRQFGARVEDAFGTAVQRVRQRALLVATVIILVFGAVGVILWIGGHDVLAGRISAGQLSAFVFYAVIVASSGMLAGGPSLAYARALAGQPQHAILLTGYQDEESPGRRLQEMAARGRGTLRLGKDKIDVQARLGTYSLSAHADTGQLSAIVRPASQEPRK